MAEVGTYYVTIIPDMSKFTGSVNSALSSAGTAGGKKYSSSFLDVVKGSALGAALGGLAAKAGSAIMSGLSTGIDRADTLRNFPRVMEAMGYNADDASTQIDKIMERLRGLPASTQDVVRLTQAIADSTGDLGLAADGALAFTDAMIAQGASAGEVTQAQGVLNRILGKGNATAAQWQSLQSVMTPQMAAVAKELLGESGSVEELRDKLNDGTISWNDWLEAMVRLDNEGSGSMKSFYEQAKANSDGIGTAIQNMGWRIGTGWASIFNAIGVENISGPINSLSDFISGSMSGIAEAIKWVKDAIAETDIVKSLGEIGKVVGEFVSNMWTESDTELVKTMATAFIELVDGALKWLAEHGEVVTVILGGIVGALTGLMGLSIGTKLAALPGTLTTLWTAMSANPIGIIVVGITTLVAALAYFFTQTETGKAIVKGFCDTAVKLWNGLKQDFINAFNAIKQNLEDNKVQWQKFKQNIVNWNEEMRTKILEKWEAIKKAISDKVTAIKEGATQLFEGMRQGIRNKIQEIHDSALYLFSSIHTAITEKIAAAKETALGLFDAIREGIRNKIQEAHDSVLYILSNIQTGFSDRFNAAKETVLGIFEGIRSGIIDKLQWAYDGVRGIIDNIKGLFNFSWSLPRPALPHINWHWNDIGGILSIPVFDGISWYAKGGVFDAASIIGIGERGREAALPLNRETYSEIARGIVAEGGGGVVIEKLADTIIVREEADIDRICEALATRVRRETAFA